MKGDEKTNVVELEGEIEIYSAENLKKSILSKVNEGIHHIIVDLEKVTYIDSSGLSMFVSVQKTIKQQGGSLTLKNISKPIHKIFELTGLTKFFVILSNEERMATCLNA